MRNWFIIILLFFSAELLSQDSTTVPKNDEVAYDRNSAVTPIPFDQESIADFKDDSDFDYTEIKEEDNFWEDFKRWFGELWERFWSALLGDYKANNFWSLVISAIPYIIIAGIIVFVVWLFIKLNPGARLLQSKKTGEIFFTEEEEIVKSRDIYKYIQQALEHKDYRLAIRYYYLLILRKLTDAELIHYEFDKTNTDYIREIEPVEINSRFKTVTTLYDYIWYGSFDVTRQQYGKAQETFSELEQQISANLE